MIAVVLGAIVFFVIASVFVFASVFETEHDEPLFPLFAEYRWNGWPEEDEELHVAA